MRATVARYGTRCTLHKYPSGTYDSMHLDITTEVAREATKREQKGCKFTSTRFWHQHIIIKLADRSASRNGGKS